MGDLLDRARAIMTVAEALDPLPSRDQLRALGGVALMFGNYDEAEEAIRRLKFGEEMSKHIVAWGTAMQRFCGE